MLVLPDDFDDYGWEVEAKGWFGGARLRALGKEFPLTFYDPTRLAQDVESEHEHGDVFFEPNLVVVSSVTRRAMEQAAEYLVSAGRLDGLMALQ